MSKNLPAICKIITALLLLVTIKVTAQPTITSFNPASGIAGTSVIITGTNFNPVQTNNIVYFGAVKATITSASATSLTATVPTGATYQPISVLNIVTNLTGYSSKPFIITFINPYGTGIPPNFYKPKIDFITSVGPNDVAIGDVDGDGKSDLLTANQTSTVSVLRNTSITGNIIPSSFAVKVDLITGSNPYSIATGDVDRDGKPDIVVANANDKTISVLRNTSTTGSITTAAKIDFATGSFPTSVAIGDVDGDGKPDIVVANASSGTVSVFLNTSTPGIIDASSFAAKVDFTAGFYPYCVAVGDVDGDGKPDLVTANQNGNNISVLRNTSTSGIISFQTKVDFPVGDVPRSVAMGDIDGDGKPDLVVANYNSNSLSVLRNTSTTGSISVDAKVDFTTGKSPISVAIGDVDGDGMPDLVTANNSTPYSMSVLRNTSTSGNISAAAKVDFTPGTAPISVAIGDVDGDGIPEIVIANNAQGSVSVFQIDLSILPVTLTNVKAYQQNKGVQIEWTAQEEININRYEIERSQNGLQFEKIGSVEAKGNSNTISNYNYFDANPFSGTNFYRIKIIEAGHDGYSQVLKINVNNSYENILTIYPNPITGNMIALQMNLPKGNYTIALYNKLGQQIMNKVITYAGGLSNETIELSNSLAAGIYQLRLSGNGINISRQVIKL